MRQHPPKDLRPNCLLTRYPICFIHGLKSPLCCFDYWHGIPDYLKDHGYEVREFFGPWRGPHQKRLNSFSKQISDVLNKFEKVHVIAHSLGTIDMLDLLCMKEFKGKFSSCTFVSPPFGGSPFADFGLSFGNLFESTNETLTTKNAPYLLKKYVPQDDVLVGTIISNPQNYPITPFLKVQHALLTQILKSKGLSVENDGLVPLESQRMAQSLGPIYFEFPGDHNQVIGSGPWPKTARTAHSFFLDHAIFLAEYDFKTAQ